MASPQSPSDVNLAGRSPIYQVEPSTIDPITSKGTSFFHSYGLSSLGGNKQSSEQLPTSPISINPLLEAKLNLIQKNPSMFRMMNGRLREFAQYSQNRHILNAEIGFFLEELKIVDMGEEIRRHNLEIPDPDIPDSSPSWFRSTFLEVTKSMFASDNLASDGDSSTVCSSESSDNILCSPSSPSNTTLSASSQTSRTSWEGLSPVRKTIQSGWSCPSGGSSSPTRKALASEFTGKTNHEAFLSLPPVDKEQ
jgi:hypothetical protein